MKCVTIDGALLRVSRDFDETPGSADMLAAAELVRAMRNPPPVDEFVTKHGRPR